jgi:hypothetical protein
MEVVSLRMIIEWPNGSRLPVRVSSNATRSNLIALLQRASPGHSAFLLVKDGHCLHPEREQTDPSSSCSA